jgi:hypothetical protein
MQPWPSQVEIPCETNLVAAPLNVACACHRQDYEESFTSVLSLTGVSQPERLVYIGVSCLKQSYLPH